MKCRNTKKFNEPEPSLAMFRPCQIPDGMHILADIADVFGVRELTLRRYCQFGMPFMKVRLTVSGRMSTISTVDLCRNWIKRNGYEVKR